MGKLSRVGLLQHAAVGLTTVCGAGLGLFGIFDRQTTERFDAKTIVVQPVGADGVRITEYVDQDFANLDKHGYQRKIPEDFGVPTDITASSPDAPDNLSVRSLARVTTIRVGDPNVTTSGQHRYEVAYTLPAARISTGELALDIIGTNETLRTTRFEVIVVGMTLADPTCNVGSLGSFGGCTLESTTINGTAAYRTVIEPLDPGHGVTIGGQITATDRAVPTPPAPPIPDRRDALRPDMAAAMLAIGALTGGVVFAGARRAGRNEVAGGGAADAAFGARPPSAALPPPSLGSAASAPSVIDQAALGPTRLVSDSQLARMATIEFVPPTGIAPWEGAALLSEKLTNETVNAWFSGLAADDIVEFGQDGETTVMRVGRNFAAATGADGDLLAKAFQGRQAIELGTYDRDFALAFAAVRGHQSRMLAESGFWRRMSPGVGGGGRGFGGFRGLFGLGFVVAVWLVMTVGSTAFALASKLNGWPAAIGFAILVPLLVGLLMYRSMLPARSALGSALALRTESFRRFLEASEAKHVEWAWQHGLLREYSAWAVALGEADAWRRAMDASSVIPAAELTSGPMVIWYHAPAFDRTSVRPAPTGGSSGGGGGGWGGGGFSGGSVGGGGGGGSSGSW